MLDLEPARSALMRNSFQVAQFGRGWLEVVIVKLSLYCYWVGFLDFNIFGEIKGFSTEPPKS